MAGQHGEDLVVVPEEAFRGAYVRVHWNVAEENHVLTLPGRWWEEHEGRGRRGGDRGRGFGLIAGVGCQAWGVKFKWPLHDGPGG